MAIVGEPIPGYVANQITVRQLLHGSGQDFDRTDQQINLLNSNTAWVKLASGISVSADRLTDIGVSTSLSGMDLAKRYILHAGFSKLEENGVNRLVQREGFLPQNSNSSYTYGTYGYSPMPGILDADIKTLNRGSIKKATVRLVANNKQQFDIIDLLYLRLGYTVLLEWGNSLFTEDGVNRNIVRDTLLENSFFTAGEKKSYLDILPDIEFYRSKYAGNYDALLAKVSNFSWSFEPDGSYKIEINLISLGDVIESLKTNISVPQSFKKFTEILGISESEEESQARVGRAVEALAGLPPEEQNAPTEDTTDVIEGNKNANALFAMLWTWKWTNRNDEENRDPNFLTQISSNPITFSGLEKMGGFVDPGGKTVQTKTTSVTFSWRISREKYKSKYGTMWIGESPLNPKVLKNFPDLNRPDWFSDVTVELASDNPAQLTANILEKEKELLTGLSVKIQNESIFKEVFNIPKNQISGDTSPVLVTEYADRNGRTGIKNVFYFELESTENSTNAVTAENPIKNFGKKDCFFLNISPAEYYLRFGALLGYISKDVIPKINTNEPEYSKKPPLIRINFRPTDNIMFTLKHQISLDPRVCLIGNKSFYSYPVLPEVLPFKFSESDTNNPFKDNLSVATSMNIYLNFNFIAECINSNADERGDVNVYNFIKSICEGLNKVLGGINNLEPVINEDNNSLSIIDTTPIPGINQDNDVPYILQLYGYKKNGNFYESNFVRKVDLKTAITPEYATMITVGATAGGYVKGVEATAFSKWNKGLTDRFKEDLVPGNSFSENKASPTVAGAVAAVVNAVSGAFSATQEEDEAVVNYNNNYFGGRVAHLYGFGITHENKIKMYPDLIDKNISIVTEYNKYTMASNNPKSGGTIGFIPFKISFTMDGISGIKIYNKLLVDTRFLPKAYGDNLNLIVTGVSHKLSNNDWETEIEATIIPKVGDIAEFKGGIVKTSIYEQYAEAVQSSNISFDDAPLGPIPPVNWVILHPKYPNTTPEGKNIDLIIDTFKRRGVTNPYTIVGLLCVIGKESGWIPQREKLKYSKERLPEVWGRFSKTGRKVPQGQGKYNFNSLAVEYAGNEEKLANFVYGWNGSNPQGARSKQESYGNLVWGDGFKYRGRGFNQITFKNIYAEYGQQLGLDLVNNPDLLLQPKIAAEATFLFMQTAFKYGKIPNAVSVWNKYTSVDEAIVAFCKANAGNVRQATSNVIDQINAAKSKRKYFDIKTT
jgi:predicted chitinase